MITEEATVMQHKGSVTMETNRLLLRKFTLQDSKSAFKNWTSDEKITTFLRWPTHQNIETTQEVIKSWVEQYRNPNYYQWAIVLKDCNEAIGSIGVVMQNEDLDILHIGYCIGSAWWNQGITSEAFSSIIPFLFDEVKANRIESQHDPRNPNSGKVMMKCGLKYEGTLREADRSNQGIVDAAMYSLLAKEYRSHKDL